MRVLATAAVLGCMAPVLAQAQPLQVEACERFLQAYQQCAATPGLLPAVKDSIEKSLPDLRANFGRADASNPAVRDAMGQQCLQLHTRIRQSLVENMRCNFPEPIGAVAGAPVAPGVTPRSSRTARPAANPEQAEIAKVNAYVSVQNSIVTFHPIARNLADYQSSNERVLREGTRLGANAWYSFSIGDFDGVIERLEKATALPTPVPEVDEAANTLLKALRDVNPVVKALNRYQTTREFKEDAYAFAREQHPILVSRMKAAAQAAEGFENALFNRAMARDEKLMASLPEGALLRQLLDTSLSVRRAVQQFEALAPRGDPAAFQAAVSTVAAKNRTLGMALDGLTPKAHSNCLSYTKTLDSFVGHGRDIVRDLRGNSSTRQAADGFNRYYNRSVEDLQRCREGEARAQG